jgi:hypothetical protein
MLDPLPAVLIAACLLLALVVAVYVALARPVDDPVLLGLVVIEAGLVAQLVIGIVRLSGTDRDVDAVVFVGYLVGALVVLPVGALWSLAERSRSGTAVLIVALLTVAFLVVRLTQIWG